MKNMFYLINSPMFFEETVSEDNLPPLGQGYIATYLNKSGIPVAMVDCVRDNLNAYDIVEKINTEKPSFVGINIFTQNYEIVKYIVENISTDSVLFIGGQSVKYLYNQIIQWNTVNICNVIIGEGELIIPEICKGKCIENPSVVFENKKVYKVDKNSIYFPQDISDIELNRKVFKNELLLNHFKQKEASIITSRGCVFDCAFCGGAKSLNSDVLPRMRNKQSIINEINELISIYPELESIRILDDLFLRSPKSFDVAINIFSKYNHLTWRGMAHVVSLKNSVEKLPKLHDCGCRELFIGFESGSSRIREKINKLGTCEDILYVSEKVLACGIDLKGYFIFGFPGETESDFKNTLNLALQIKKISEKTKGVFRSSVFQFRPYHGTKLYNELTEQGIDLSPCVPNDKINEMIGRKSFNFSSGNYSCESDEILNKYIEATQRLVEI